MTFIHFSCTQSDIIEVSSDKESRARRFMRRPIPGESFPGERLSLVVENLSPDRFLIKSVSDPLSGKVRFESLIKTRQAPGPLPTRTKDEALSNVYETRSNFDRKLFYREAFEQIFQSRFIGRIEVCTYSRNKSNFVELRT